MPQATYEHIVGVLLTQMTAAAGIRKHGEVAVNALLKEFCQLDDKSVFEPLDASTLSREQKAAALRSISLIKEKRCGKIKGRTCADGRKQRLLYDKSDTSSPTISLDALLMTLIIDAKERRDVATADVVGAYLNADMKDFVVLRMEAEAVDIMCKVNPKYEQYVVKEKGKRVLYLRLVKALYGCVQSALLWYELFVSALEPMGFELNPYDPCVANATIDGKQCTIAWYVDDNKISHVDPKVVDQIIAKIEARFGKMNVTEEKSMSSSEWT
jgi:hypothetical protein